MTVSSLLGLVLLSGVAGARAVPEPIEAPGCEPGTVLSATVVDCVPEAPVGAEPGADSLGAYLTAALGVLWVAFRVGAR